MTTRVGPSEAWALAERGHAIVDVRSVEEFARQTATHAEHHSGHQRGRREEEVDQRDRQSNQRHTEADGRSHRSPLQALSPRQNLDLDLGLGRLYAEALERQRLSAKIHKCRSPVAARPAAACDPCRVARRCSRRYSASRLARSRPIVVHCFAGISRSTAAAFITLCTVRPERDEHDIARRLRAASPYAFPNARLVALADGLLEREGRMIAAIQSIGRGEIVAESVPFGLALEG